MIVRKAVISDVPAIQKLVNDYAGQGLMLPRSLHSLYEHLRDYVVAVEGETILGCIALHISWQDLAEIRSLAVSEDRQGSGVGRLLVEEALAEAQNFGIGRVFVLTFVPDFFAAKGFRKVDKADLPHKIWQECVHCVHFPDCGEEALVMDLEETGGGARRFLRSSESQGAASPPA
jgi:amino-acid N-acetyltransferase